MKTRHITDGRKGKGIVFLLLMLSLIIFWQNAWAEEALDLQGLIDEAVKNSPDIRAFGSRSEAARYRIPQAGNLPDPMFMFGYQNEGFQRITIGEETQAMGMFSLSQMFYFPGKRSIREEMARWDAEGIAALHDAAKLRLAARVKEVYYELFLAYKIIDILKERADIFTRVEDAANARYSSGTGMQQEVLMAQTEKYMLLEREEMQKQKIETLKGMLNSLVGRPVTSPLGRPSSMPLTRFTLPLGELLSMAREHSPEVRSKEKMVKAAEAKVKMAKKDYYPDVTIGTAYFPRTQGLMDMWNLTATINLPIYYKTKQAQAVLEASASVNEAKNELQATELMLASSVRESYSMGTSAERLMTLYKDALIPKAQQDVQLSLSGYVTGKTDAITIVTRLKTFLDVELLYWNQHTEREKAIARLHALTATQDMARGAEK